jgi:hypothetical protein
MVGHTTPDRLAGAWTVLFPLTYCLHVAEEYWGGETFYGWVSRVWQIDLTRDEFLTLNAIAMGVMIVAVLVANVTTVRLPIPAFGFVVVLNGSLHVIASVVTASYSPGAISGVLVWVPLGVYALRRSHRALRAAEFYGGIALGALAHGLVSWVALGS